LWAETKNVEDSHGVSAEWQRIGIGMHKPCKEASMDARAHLWLLNHNTSFLSFGGGDRPGAPRVAPVALYFWQRIGGTGFASRAVTARKSGKRGFFKRLKLGKLLGAATHFIRRRAVDLVVI